MRPSRAGVLVGVAALAAALAVSGVAVREGADPSQVDVTIDVADRGRAIPASFLGFSMETPHVTTYAGPAATPNRALARLLATLGAAQGSPPALRIGGNSTDESWWAPGPGRPRPRIASLVLGRAWRSRVAWLARATHAPLTVGLNLAAEDPVRALAFARALEAALPADSLRTLEIGNEPDLYSHGRTFAVGRQRVHRPTRHAGYDQVRYAADVRRYLAVLTGRTRARLAIGGFATAGWDGSLPSILRRAHGDVGALSAHAYQLDGCPPHAGRAAQLERLLAPLAPKDLAAMVGRVVDIGRAAHVPVRVTELNSAACGGVPGISDTFAAALWVPAVLFEMARRGVDGVDVHTWLGAPYAPFVVGAAHGVPTVDAAPLFYGLLLFARAARHGSRLLATTVATDSSTRAWATLAPDGRVNVVVVNPTSDVARVTLSLRRGHGGVATLRLLRAAALGARGHVTFAGEAIGSDGRLRGRDSARRLAPHPRGYAVTLPAACAALLTIAPARGGSA